MPPRNFSRKSRIAAALLCVCFGIFGAHRFYVGKAGTGLLQLLTIGGLGIWTMIDLIFILIGSFRDFEGRRVFLWIEPEEEDEILQPVVEKLEQMERRLNDMQDIILSLDDKLDRISFGKDLPNTPR